MENNLDLGQHFLVDNSILDLEVEVSNLTKKDKVIEIGLGEGILTKEISKKVGNVLGFEIDLKLKKELDKLKKDYKNLEIIYDDSTKHSWKGYDKIVSNIPYHLSEKIILKSINEEIPFLVLIVGENFKEILEKNETKSGILANLFYEIQFIKKIEKESFSPPPRVNSWLIKLVFKKEDKILNFLRYILNRNGKLKNAIIYWFVESGFTKKQSKEFLEKINLDKKLLDSSTKRISGKTIFKIVKEFYGNFC